MPRPRRSNLSQRSRNAIRQRNIASHLSDEEREIAREQRRVSMEQRRALIRASQTQEQREVAHETARLETRNRRAYRTDEQRNNLRSARRNGSSIDLNRAAFLYDCTIDYSSHRLVCIGPMDVVSQHCGALRFAGETPGWCCLSEEYQIEFDQNEVDYDVCKLETVEHTFTDEDKSHFVPATRDNMPEVNMFAVVEYLTKHEKELKQLDFPRLKLLTKNNPRFVSSPLVLQAPPSSRLRATVTLLPSTSHMCELEYNTRTDTIASSECVCGTDVCEHTAAFVMWLAGRPGRTNTTTSTGTSAGGDRAELKLRKSQASNSGKKTKPSVDVGPSTSKSGGSKGDQPSAKRARVCPEVEVPVPVPPVVPDTAITVVPLPKDEDEPDKSKIECTFQRKAICTLWENVTGTTSERCEKIQTTLRTKLQDDDFVTNFTPIEQRVQQLCWMFDDMDNELHKPEYTEFMNIRETLQLDRVSKKSSFRDPLS